MIGFLRFVGIFNAAVWFGAAFFVNFGAVSAVSSQEIKELLGANYYPYFSGAIAQIVVDRYFHWQLGCGVLALFHLLAERLYLGKSLRKLGLGLLFSIIFLSLTDGFLFQPKLKELHKIRYAMKSRPEEREAARQSFGIWNGLHRTLNLFLLAGLAFYLWRVANPPETTRFLDAAKIRG